MLPSPLLKAQVPPSLLKVAPVHLLLFKHKVEHSATVTPAVVVKLSEPQNDLFGRFIKDA